MTDARTFGQLKFGDPFQFGTFRSTRLDDSYSEDFIETADMSAGTRGPNPKAGARQGGGFFGGMVKPQGRTDRCVDVPSEATCAREAGNDFNRCVATSGGNFKQCLANNTKWAALRKCDRTKPCRDDYVCLATLDTPATKVGACLPPYFLFQFRVDGHPLEKP
jgi:hypothetical protein